jgi:hypothetical protein
MLISIEFSPRFVGRTGYRIAGQEPAQYPVAMAAVAVPSNKCPWSGIKTQSKRGVAVSDKKLLRRVKIIPVKITEKYLCAFNPLTII